MDLTWPLAGVAVLCAIFYLLGRVHGYNYRLREERKKS